MIVFAFVFYGSEDILQGMININTSSCILITDYLAIGGVGAAFINSALLTIINIFLLRFLNVRPTGNVMTTIFLVTAFSFIGKNLINIWPIYLGGYLYAVVQRIEFKRIAVVTVMSTALSPLVSFLGTELDLHSGYKYLLAIAVGIIVGFIIPPISSQLLLAHNGYNLYNMGFSAGFVSIVIYSVMLSLGVETSRNYIIYEIKDIKLMFFFIFFFVFLCLVGLYSNHFKISQYKSIFWYSGRLITDFIRQIGIGLTLFNMGILGLICIGFILINGGYINGPIITAMLTVVGFGAFGKHPRNILPVLLGAYVAIYLSPTELPITLVIMTGLFSTSLAPIAGDYGMVYGFLVGLLHFFVVQNISVLHGGLDLYNNGLSTGLIATVTVPVIKTFSREKS